MQPLRTLLSVALVLTVAACGGTSATPSSASNATATNAPPPSAGGASNNSSGVTDDEVRALVTEALSPQMCPKLLGAYIGLTGEGDARGPAAGTLPISGRWWIRQCDARVVGDRLQLSMAGPGWIWVDREAMGFRIRQYVLFEADTLMSADVAVGYDRSRRVASIWMQHADGAQAHVVPRGVVSAEPTGMFASVVGAALPLTGASASDRAREQAGEMGSQTFAAKLATGFTMTMSLATRQIDFMMGSLERGEMPERPFPNDTTQPWSINQRTMVWPGGLDVIGPVDMSQGTQGLDVELEEGPGASVRAVCANQMTPYFDARFHDPNARVAPPPSTAIMDLAPGQGVRHVMLPAVMTCPTLLLVAPRADTPLPVKLRLRVAPEGSAPTSANNAGSVAAPAPPPMQRVRIEVLGVSVTPQNAEHRDWDVIGGEADPYLVTASVPLGREIDRTAAVTDNNNASWNRWLPGAYDIARDLPLRFTAMDEDGTTDDVIGTADLSASLLPLQASEIALPLRATGAIPTQTGTLRLRIEPAQ